MLLAPVSETECTSYCVKLFLIMGVTGTSPSSETQQHVPPALYALPSDDLKQFKRVFQGQQTIPSDRE